MSRRDHCWHKGECGDAICCRCYGVVTTWTPDKDAILNGDCDRDDLPVPPMIRRLTLRRPADWITGEAAVSIQRSVRRWHEMSTAYDKSQSK